MQESTNHDKIQLNIFKNLLIFVKPYKGLFLILTTIMVILGVLDSIFPLLTKYAIDNFVEKRNITGLGRFEIIYFLP